MIIKYALNDINLNYRLLYTTNSCDNIKLTYGVIHCVSEIENVRQALTSGTCWKIIIYIFENGKESSKLYCIYSEIS